MTIPTTASRVLDVARREIGTHESPAGSNRQRYGAWAHRDGVAWCGIFTTWVFAAAGYDWRAQIPGFPYTPALEAGLSRMGWARVNPQDARPGDVVFFDFPDHVDRIQHVGIVESNNGRELTTIEGNTSITSDDNGGEVMRRQRPYRLVAAVRRPPYSVPASKVRIRRVLKRRRLFMMRGDDVRAVQRLVGLQGNDVDGKYGPQTERAVRTWQRAHHLTVDGEFGEKSTRAAGWVWAG